MSFFALPIAEPFWLLLAGLLFFVSASVIHLRLSRKGKTEGQDAE
jgi:hypothetical protein